MSNPKFSLLRLLPDVLLKAIVELLNPYDMRTLYRTAYKRINDHIPLAMYRCVERHLRSVREGDELDLYCRVPFPEGLEVSDVLVCYPMSVGVPIARRRDIRPDECVVVTPMPTKDVIAYIERCRNMKLCTDSNFEWFPNYGNEDSSEPSMLLAYGDDLDASIYTYDEDQRMKYVIVSESDSLKLPPPGCGSILVSLLRRRVVVCSS